MSAHKDFLGREIDIHAVVAFKRPSYSDLTVGIVCKCTPQNVKVTYRPNWGDHTANHLLLPSDVVVVNGDETTILQRVEWLKEQMGIA